MTADRSSRTGSSTSPTTPSLASPPSPPGSSASGSSGSRLLSRRALQDLALRHDIRPSKALGQHFLADPNLARAIARDAGAAPGERFVEIGAGLGSLTLALAESGAEVLALELDRRLLSALGEVTAGEEHVRVVREDATRAVWSEVLGAGSWRMASNLPYNVAVPVVLDLLEHAPGIDPMVIMVQREVGERLAARPGEAAFGAVSLKVAYRAEARVTRRIPRQVFWPEPKVESVLVRLERRPPSVDVPERALFALVEEGFAQRRKTMANALARLGHPRERGAAALRAAGLDERVRAEELGLE
ncbi:MAG TPA: 16S rRNA (adenine(1518)-N(6)/adenine(1519)-N(6))-dimethyltransferase RsmA, partial [Actinomycetota bacterium]|nr:16S rRNA (adenine(1518)-N(6)/adenine(1519)-N(6))-dimethyltransferase RsmA [Actinomycetota bacterium]